MSNLTLGRWLSDKVPSLVNDVTLTMQNAVVHNYIAPGLDSYLLNKNDCKVRLFEMTKNQEFYISPHNHRFDFACCVLRGSVIHHLYREGLGIVKELAELGNSVNAYAVYEYVSPGFDKATEYKHKLLGYEIYERETQHYSAGDWYGLRSHQFHSIEFTQGSRVLFLEGANQKATSEFLEPIVNGKIIPYFSVPDWMYKP